MFASSRYLHLELLCTHGTPVNCKERLGHLPAFPIVISFLDPFLDGDGDDLIAALGHRDRVRIVEISVPLSLFEELATAMQEPLPALTHLRFESDKFVPVEMPTLPDSFLGGSAPLLETISITGIPFPAVPTLLSSARNLVNVDLCEMPESGYIPPEAMVASLAVLPKLKYLTLGYEWGTSYHDRMRLPSITRTVLPALTKFSFDGHFEYLEDLVALIDAPQLNFLHIDYQDQDNGIDYQIPQLFKFIDRSEILKLSCFRRADVFIEPYAAIVELDRGQSSFRLSIQEDAVGQVVNQLSALLFNVDRLFITSKSKEEDLGDGIRWLDLFRPFTAVKVLCIDNELSCHIPLALDSVTDERAAEVLPALKLLWLENESMTFVKKFVAARQNVGCTVTFMNEVFQERHNPLLESLDIFES
jgi:hypothetical protein